ncbi:MAG: hypothetical protein NZ805_12065 [Armatimonadetes bacterium]|nr:hypothetical protein [Armatimonadota bacterium]MDW8028379.1 hypothetical protein [Armatimonadota bacterium]
MSRKTKRAKHEPSQLSFNELVEGLKQSFAKLLLSLYAASRLADTEEEKAKLAQLIQLAEKIESETMANLGEPSQQAELKALLREISDLSNLAQSLDKGFQVKKTESERKKRQKPEAKNF